MRNAVLALVVLLALGGAGWWWLQAADGTGHEMGHASGRGPSDSLPRAMMSTAMAGIAEGAPIVAPVLPERLDAQAQMGKRAFDARCAECHGANAAGIRGKAPPLVHKIYEPSHHADFAFVRAVQSGVRAHHWPFGDMPPVEGLTQADVTAIASYVRALQWANGIR